jgi:hypothetical protein
VLVVALILEFGDIIYVQAVARIEAPSSTVPLLGMCCCYTYVSKGNVYHS